jgi:hypothetical protein
MGPPSASGAPPAFDGHRRTNRGQTPTRRALRRQGFRGRRVDPVLDTVILISEGVRDGSGLSRTDDVDEPQAGVSDERWLPLAEAAPLLGISIDALRKRVARGRAEVQRDNAGRWRVLVQDASKTPAGMSVRDTAPDVLDDVANLWAELRVARTDLDRSRTELAEVVAEREGLRARLDERDGQLACLRADVTDLRDERDRLLAVIEALAARRRWRWPGARALWGRFLNGTGTDRA